MSLYICKFTGTIKRVIAKEFLYRDEEVQDLSCRKLQ